MSKLYTYTGLSDGQTYWIRVVVTDNAGNIGKSAEDNGGTQIATPSANTSPYNLTTSAPTNLRTTTSLTITASATDNEQTTLYYDLYWNGSSAVTQTVQGTKGHTVTFTAKTGLAKRTSYSWKIVVRDGAGGIFNGASTSVYTNCPGSDATCTPNKVTCDVCLGHNAVCADCGGWKVRATTTTRRHGESGNLFDTFTEGVAETDCTSCGRWMWLDRFECSYCGAEVDEVRSSASKPCGSCDGRIYIRIMLAWF